AGAEGGAMNAVAHAVLDLFLLLLLRGSVLIALGAVACFLLRRRSAALRHAIWCAVLVAVVLLPIVQPRVPRWHVPIPAPTSSGSAAAMPAPVLLRDEFTPPVPPRTHPANLLVFVWATVAATLLVRLGLAHRRLGDVARRARAHAEGTAASLLSDEISIPVVAGLFRPRILMPVASLGWTPACRRDAIAHEMAHLRRGDLWWLTLARAMAAIFWFHPLVHFAGSRLRVEAERASDDAVLRGGEEPSRYAEVLLDLSSQLAALRYGAGIPLLRHRHLSERIEGIVAKNASHAPMRRGTLLAFAPLALLALGVVASPTLGSEETRIEGKAPNAPEAQVRVLSVTARLTTLSSKDALLDSPELALENATDHWVRSVSVRLVTHGLSTDQFWCAVTLAPWGRATLRIPASQW